MSCSLRIRTVRMSLTFLFFILTVTRLSVSTLSEYESRSPVFLLSLSKASLSGLFLQLKSRRVSSISVCADNATTKHKNHNMSSVFFMTNHKCTEEYTRILNDNEYRAVDAALVVDSQ